MKRLIEDVKNNNFGFDCASKNEIKLVLQNGANPREIIFSNPVKLESDIEYAYRKGVRITTADTIEELMKIQSVAPKMKILWRVSI
jgi:diaminopimelate decarboxylase